MYRFLLRGRVVEGARDIKAAMKRRPTRNNTTRERISAHQMTIEKWQTTTP
jgi:hypothetical protein